MQYNRNRREVEAFKIANRNTGVARVHTERRNTRDKVKA